MSNKEINWIEHRGRVYLKDVLPLDTPFKIEIEPASSCNFKCIYCRHSSVKIESEFMTMETFDKIIEGAKKFKNKIKTFNFCGIGEPLLNKNIYHMIPKSNEIANDTVLVTNGVLLTKENSDKLIESGIKTIRVSLQGINEEDYYKTCGYKIDFKKFLNNIKYLYENKSESTKLFLKMPDIAINTEEKKNLFYELFEDKCDYLTIQNITNNWEDVDFSYLEDINKNILGYDLKHIKICHFPFYTLSVDKTGLVYPCCHTYDNIFICSIYDKDIFDIWNSKKLKEFRLKLLTKYKQNIDICNKCNIPYSYTNDYDNLDNNIEDLLHKYN